VEPNSEDVVVFNLVQALQETRALTEDHPDDPAWMELQARVDGVLDQLTGDAKDPTTPAIGSQRLRRPPIASDQAELAAAALMAVHDRPERHQLDLARAAVDDLADAIE
jgi:hypothetical protein